MNHFNHARAEELKYHEKFYSENRLFEPGTWLSMPVKVVLDLLETMEIDDVRVLDLGCGVGRNSIPIAQRIVNRSGQVVGVDILQSAIDLMMDSARSYEVQDIIIPLTADVEFYHIHPDHFDYIVACSCLEHMSSIDAFQAVVRRMMQGTRENGINTILMSADVKEVVMHTGEETDGLIELSMTSDQVFSLLRDLYQEWEILVEKQIPQVIQEVKYGLNIEFRSNWLTFAAKKRGDEQI